MGYREKGRMEIVALVRRWQAGEAERAIARQTGMGRATVSKYLAAPRRGGRWAPGSTGFNPSVGISALRTRWDAAGQCAAAYLFQSLSRDKRPSDRTHADYAAVVRLVSIPQSG